MSPSGAHAGRALPWLCLLAAACVPAAAPPDRFQLRGSVSTRSEGSAYLFLYEPGEGPPSRPAIPRHVTAVSSVRLAADPRFVFASVERAAYRLWGFLDRDRDVRLDVELLAQPSAGDLTSAGLELAAELFDPAQGSGTASVPAPVELDQRVAFDPPALEIAGAESVVVLPDQPLLPVRFAIQATRLGGLLDQVAFPVSLADADGDGAADDLDGDGLGDLYPQLAFRFLPRGGQTVPDAGEGGESPEVLIPLFIESLQIRAALGADPARVLPLDELPLLVLPVAVTRDGTPLPAIPVGEYELVAIAESGQVWRVPSALGTEHPSQATRFRVVHGLFASGLP